jgi:hypothetical protein
MLTRGYNTEGVAGSYLSEPRVELGAVTEPGGGGS